jgi:hypothetical protein
MKAVALKRYLPSSDPESLLDVELPDPKPQGRDLLVRVHAVSVNPVDVKVRSPKDKTEASPRVLGWDAAGVLEAVGPDCRLFKAGDAVFYAGSITRPGTDSELHLVDERIVGPKPRSLHPGDLPDGGHGGAAPHPDAGGRLAGRRQAEDDAHAEADAHLRGEHAGGAREGRVRDDGGQARARGLALTLRRCRIALRPRRAHSQA